ncbi:hypothetical protein CASFOL_032615 [Castilleja foliolosa]|uniref:Dirigent protein n=1 Tax=Castilleja foliolosa TaxID=1961234 RepID=A0ABD3C3A1_9LAMI
MASIFTIFTILLLIISSSFIPLITPHQFSRQLSSFGMIPKITNLQFYFYDKFSGPKPTAQRIVTGPTSNTFFGTVVMIDDALLETQSKNSRVIGRAQGLYAGEDQTTLAFLMVVNYVFTAGKYNGSTLSVLGRNPALQTVREMPILGGTGLFRYAQGFALASTKWFNNAGDAIVEYNVTVFHFENDD